MEETALIRSHFKQVVPFSFDIEQINVKIDPPEPQPATLYLAVDGHVEWSVFSGHAWGRASVSKDAEGLQPYPIESLRLRIIMNTPDQQNSTTGSNNASTHDNDVKWIGEQPMFSGPNTSFDAYADDPNYGTWSNSCTVY